MHVDVVGLPTPHIDLQETIGRGGFAVVYRALDTKLNRLVAVKVLTGVVDQAELTHFEQECRMHGPLSNHPDIVTVYDAGYTHNGSPYLIMEYLEGGTLSDRVARTGPIPWAQAISWMLPICDAVQAAHERGVLHRDIKPSNILLGPGGAKLADFGIACGSDATSPLFAVSWLHAAPESHRNGRDERSDVYSLGSTLYELLTGRAPFWAEGQSAPTLISRLMDETPAPVPSHMAPAWLNRLVQQCLAKDPAQRPPSAAELRAALASGPAEVRVAPVAGIDSFQALPVATTTAMPGVTPSGVGPIHAAALAGRYRPEASIRPSPPPARRHRRRGIAAVLAVFAITAVASGLVLSPAGGLLRDNQGQATGQATSPGASLEVATVEQSGRTPAEEVAATSTVASSSTSVETTDATAGSSTSSSSSSSTPSTDLTVPEIVGATEEEATDELTHLGFTSITAVHKPSDSTPQGRVIAVDPGEGSSAKADTPIELTVSQGPASVEVPDLLGMTRPAAISALAERGLIVSTTSMPVERGSPLVGVVVDQDLAGGSTVAAGSTVTITIGRASFDITGEGIATAPTVVAGP